jgi:hypothetical protein
MARRGRNSHLDAPSAEEGLEQYLEICGSSGLPNVKRIARSYKAMPKSKRLDRYMAEFEDEARWANNEEAEADAVAWDERGRGQPRRSHLQPPGNDRRA